MARPALAKSIVATRVGKNRVAGCGVGKQYSGVEVLSGRRGWGWWGADDFLPLLCFGEAAESALCMYTGDTRHLLDRYHVHWLWQHAGGYCPVEWAGRGRAKAFKIVLPPP